MCLDPCRMLDAVFLAKAENESFIVTYFNSNADEYPYPGQGIFRVCA